MAIRSSDTAGFSKEAQAEIARQAAGTALVWPRTAVVLDLPMPPSVNAYYRSVKMGKRVAVLISREGREYRRCVVGAVGRRGIAKMTGRLSVQVDVYPPNKGRHDLDNLMKSLLDAMQHAGVYADDSQIDRLDIVRREVEKPGRVVVKVEEFRP